MRDYDEYINALRKCAKEHEGDKTFTGHTIVSVLCRDTADLLEEIKKDTISREKAIEEASKLCLETSYDNEKVEEMLKDLPPTTPTEPKAHWEHFKDRFGRHHIVCSHCKYREPEYVTFSRKYCPNCGEEMEGE